MTEWTSISLKESQKREIEAAQEKAGHDGAIGKFIVQQVSGDPISPNESIDVDVIVDELASEIGTDNTTAQIASVKQDVQEVLEAVQAANANDTQELREKIDKLESAVKEATQAAQSAEKSVEGLR